MLFFITLLLKLKEIAAAGSGIIGTAATPVERWAVTIIRFIMDLKYRKQVIADLSSGNAPGISMGSPDNDLTDTIVIVVFLAVMLPVIVLLFYIFVRMIISRFLRIKVKRNSGKNILPGFIAAVCHLIRALYERAFFKGRTPPAVRYYRLLKLKGRFKGIVPSPAETALEYGKRLSVKFSALENEIMYITDIFCEYTYGGIAHSEEIISRSRSYIIRILNPFMEKGNQRLEKYPEK